MILSKLTSGSSPLSRGILRQWFFPLGCKRIIPALVGNTPSSRASGTSTQDHPRSRGEYWENFATGLGEMGSSPLSRGIRGGRRPGLGWWGIIPALAGNTGPLYARDGVATDHPRSRGEYSTRRGEVNPVLGSSPLSRGIREGGRGVRPRERIIPALAGNTQPLVEQFRQYADHPRSRGEYALPVARRGPLHGSSPLSRGIPLDRIPDLGHVRIIPALAGNTARPLAGASGSQDHPHSRGEYGRSTAMSCWMRGSSPLSRGILPMSVVLLSPGRIIPALAGNTPPHRNRCSDPGDHPRSRGEYDRDDVIVGHAAGSSPLSRGILKERNGVFEGPGIIPALAGNTSAPPASPSSATDHPRSRGEYVGGVDADPLEVRIIPALAGNTLGRTSVMVVAPDHPRSRGEYNPGWGTPVGV